MHSVKCRMRTIRMPKIINTYCGENGEDIAAHGLRRIVPINECRVGKLVSECAGSLGARFGIYRENREALGGGVETARVTGVRGASAHRTGG